MATNAHLFTGAANLTIVYILINSDMVIKNLWKMFGRRGLLRSRLLEINDL